ncbi:MAG: DUF1015 domain-containing protein [Nitrospira sp.]|nr:DUF1015 domain-containing protein [Nitrospira sp.]
MSQILPFQGTLYDTAAVGKIENLVAPPYDIIDTAGQQALHDRHPQNIIRLELGLDRIGDNATDNRYTRAGIALREWIKSGALKQDQEPAIYYHTPSSGPGAPTKLLRGFLTAVKLEALDSGHIYPHENTRAAAKTDRLNLIEACRANFSPIWSLYSDPKGAIIGLLESVTKGTPARYDFQDDAGCRERLWAVTDPAVLKQIVDQMQSTPLFIADGHHRYETALNYQKLRRQAGSPAGLQPYDSVLMLLAPLEDPGLTVLPTHRVTTTPLPSYDRVKALLGNTFDFQEFPYTAETKNGVRAQFLDTLRTNGRTAPVFGIALKGDSREGRQPLSRAHVETGPSSVASGVSTHQTRRLAAATAHRRHALPHTTRTRSDPLHQRRPRSPRLGSPGNRNRRTVAQRDKGRRNPSRRNRRRTHAAQVDLFLSETPDRTGHQCNG